MALRTTLPIPLSIIRRYPTLAVLTLPILAVQPHLSTTPSQLRHHNAQDAQSSFDSSPCRQTGGYSRSTYNDKGCTAASERDGRLILASSSAWRPGRSDGRCGCGGCLLASGDGLDEVGGWMGVLVDCGGGRMLGCGLCVLCVLRCLLGE
jgi:hypothetical protein